MNAVDFNAVLSTVEQDHQLVVQQLQVLRGAVTSLMKLPSKVKVQAVLGRLSESYRFFAERFEAHMEEEEHTLFPFLARQMPDGHRVVERLRADHEEIRSLCKQFGRSLDAAHESGDRPPRDVLRDVLTYGWELWEALDDHAHEETEEIRRAAEHSWETAAVN